MWVKDHFNAIKSMDFSSVDNPVKFLTSALAFLKTWEEIDKEKESFARVVREKVKTSMFDYFPEMKAYAEKIEEQYNKIIDKHYGTVFEDAFAVIYQFIDKPDRSNDGRTMYSEWKDDEEIEAKAEEMAQMSAPEIRENFRKGMILSMRNRRHYNHFRDIIVEQLLACITEVFEDIPDLPGNGMRLLASVMCDRSVWLFDDLKGILADKVVDPYDEDAFYDSLGKNNS